MHLIILNRNKKLYRYPRFTHTHTHAHTHTHTHTHTYAHTHTHTHTHMHAHTHTHTHAHTHTALTFERIYMFRNAIDCRLDLGTQIHLLDGRSLWCFKILLCSLKFQSTFLFFVPDCLHLWPHPRLLLQNRARAALFHHPEAPHCPLHAAQESSGGHGGTRQGTTSLALAGNLGHFT